VGATVDELEWPANGHVHLERKTRSARGTKTRAQKTPVVRFVNQAQRILAYTSVAELTMRVPWTNTAWRCGSRLSAKCCLRLRAMFARRNLQTTPDLHGHGVDLAAAQPRGPAGQTDFAWTDREFFSHGVGLAIAAALEDETYPLDELIYDLANLDGGFRFCGEENRWGGRLRWCARKVRLAEFPGLSRNGLPPKYGAARRPSCVRASRPAGEHQWSPTCWARATLTG